MTAVFETNEGNNKTASFSINSLIIDLISNTLCIQNVWEFNGIACVRQFETTANRFKSLSLA